MIRLQSWGRDSGIRIGGEEREWKTEASRPVLLASLLLWQTWLADSQGMLAGVGDGVNSVSVEEGGRRRSV